MCKFQTQVVLGALPAGCHKPPVHTILFTSIIHLHIWVKIPWNAYMYSWNMDVHSCILEYVCIHNVSWNILINIEICMMYTLMYLDIPSHDPFIIIIIVSIIYLCHHVNHLSLVQPSGKLSISGILTMNGSVWWFSCMDSSVIICCFRSSPITKECSPLSFTS